MSAGRRQEGGFGVDIDAPDDDDSSKFATTNWPKKLRVSDGGGLHQSNFDADNSIPEQQNKEDTWLTHSGKFNLNWGRGNTLL